MEQRPDRDDGRRQSVFWTTLPGILTGLAGVLAAVGTILAVVIRDDDTPLPVPTPVATQAVASVTAVGTPERTATPEPTATPERTPKPKPTAVPGDDWPPARDAYTVILASKTTRTEAKTVADEALGDLPAVGVLRSDAHPGLNAGYWVAYSGAFDARARATRNAADARAIGFPSAYVRWIQGR
jgi:hypothetical protein